MPRAPFSLFRRPTRQKNRHIWYVQFWNEETGRYTTARSTGQTNKNAAKRVAYQWLAEGEAKPQSRAELSAYLLDFWDPERSSYIKGRIARGRTISRSYAANNRNWLREYFIPYFERRGITRLSAVTPKHIEEWLMHTDETTNLSRVTINKILQAAKVAFAEAFRVGDIRANPCSVVERLAEEPKERGVPTTEELKALFESEWQDYRCYAITLLAFTAGLRLGECRGLLHENVGNGVVDVVHSYVDNEGLKAPKAGSRRRVPLPAKTNEAVSRLIAENPWGGPYVFYSTESHKPIAKRTVERELYRQLRAIGISEAERKERALSFHSGRHWYVSFLRGQLPDSKVMLLSGHRNVSTADIYTHGSEEDMQAARKLLENVWE